MIEATKEDEGLLRQILSSFSCNKDEDIENSLRIKKNSMLQINEFKKINNDEIGYLHNHCNMI